MRAGGLRAESPCCSADLTHRAGSNLTSGYNEKGTQSGPFLPASLTEFEPTGPTDAD
jgi:hypothetical protein